MTIDNILVSMLLPRVYEACFCIVNLHSLAYLAKNMETIFLVVLISSSCHRVSAIPLGPTPARQRDRILSFEYSLKTILFDQEKSATLVKYEGLPIYSTA